MTKPNNPSRRQFIRTSAALGTGLMLELHLTRNALASSSDAANHFTPNAWLEIQPDNTVIFTLAESEMGQGVMTSLPMILAEELEVNWQHIQVRQAPYNPIYGKQSTGGSTSVSQGWEVLRHAGATARIMLIAAAAQQWKVTANECRAENSRIIHPASGRSFAFGELAQHAAQQSLPTTVKLKRPNEYRIIGKSMPRLDSPKKITGTAEFGIDVRVPDMLIATIKHSPVFGGKVKTIDDSLAKTMPGVKKIVNLGDSVAVIANNFWTAKKALDVVKLTWSTPADNPISSATLRQQFIAALAKPGAIARNDGDGKLALNGTTRIDADYSVPFQAHATMEPMNCTAHVHDGGCEIWAPTQTPSTVYSVALAHGLSSFDRFMVKLKGKVSNTPSAAIRVNTTLIGGGFGRRLETDFVKEAILLSKAVAAPVKLIWTREEDIQHDFYRPMALARLSATLDNKGNVLSWSYKLASPSLQDADEPGSLGDEVDAGAVSGARNLPYTIPNINVVYVLARTPAPIGPWRSVGNSINGFITECFMDELAYAAKKDPVAFRLAYLKDKPQHSAVLELAASKSGWGKKLSPGHALGAAVHYSFGSYVAQVAEVSLGKNNKLIVHKVTCAVDCGLVVNPDSAVAQIEGAIVFGLTATLKSAITLEHGAVVQSNFHDFPLLDISEMPSIEVHFIPSDEDPRGLGEPGVPPIAAAVMNAYFALTKKRVRQLPFTTQPA